ncbi:MAG: RNA-binding transcriptional accessory protein, partial [Deltaproteobacteria bacterium]|nr:RNA-binding transcriptional accessory protein [Deltaproteobacteria bacterium]
MEGNFAETVARELGLALTQVARTAELLEQGGTVPFIARYRKEMTGDLDEVQIIAVRDRLKALGELSDRLGAMLASLTERGLLTGELEEKLRAAETMAKLEDAYLPFRPKRKTRAMAAREKGLEPLALELMGQAPGLDPVAAAGAAMASGAQADSPEAALALARDIIAELISEDGTARARLRELFASGATISSRVKAGQEAPAQKFRDYFDHSERVATIPSHRYLAIMRAEASGFVIVQVQPDPEEALAAIRDLFVKNDGPAAAEVEKALTDSYKRLLCPSMETETRLAAKKKADLEAIGYFSKNLRELLMAPPLSGLNVLAIDPGFRTGCKMVALSADGSLLDYATIQPHASEGERLRAGKSILGFLRKHSIGVVAIGNGTAGRETYKFIKSLQGSLPGFPEGLPTVMASESGASVYSASEVAREEFPDLDLTVRGAISIGRRLIDPLAELVKIDPKSIGVGQYQHDVDQSALKNGLDDTVVSCVNSVGVEVNTASEKLLGYVSGLGPSLARNVVKYRNESGPFKNRFELLKVPRLGAKAFELCAGFLRLASGDNPLDRSAVHPESYGVVEKMASDLGVPVLKLIGEPKLRQKIKPVDYVTEKVGLPTVNDILAELEKPGRDPRGPWDPYEYAEGVNGIEDLTPGQALTGVVTNLTAFGAFVDVGVHVDGLVHVSQITDGYVKNVSDFVRVGQKVAVWVLKVEPELSRVSLTMVDPAKKNKQAEKKPQNPPRL